MKKKRAAGMFCMMMAVSVAVPVSAAQKQESMTLTLDVGSEYTLTIPMDMDIPFGAEETNIGSVKVTGNVKPAETVEVDVEIGNFISQDNPQDTIALTLINKNDNSEFGTSIWNEKEMRDETKEIPLAVQVKEEDWAKAYAGTYQATLTFTASLITPSAP
ncbi:MAG TPA: hypothetical protein IAA21_06870 [Candidatus Blautia faecigallinarum]|uniref:WxL domain-containing protein n=1 Tax=Candidatus Blautia faecigallinarum TaxID=2838488 RepID=A0A9D2DSY8_9FIRM|nr:hypothetical protein [Candidatus Blautia faecigallinarum]